MSEKRFVYEEEHFPVALMQIKDTISNKTYDLEECCELLNEQQTIILNLKLRLEKINGGYGHLTHKKGLTPNEWLLSKQERELKEKDEQISNWIEQHSKDIVRISEQQSTIGKLQRYNDVLHDENLFNTMKMLEFMKEKGVFDEFYDRIKKEVFGDE